MSKVGDVVLYSIQGKTYKALVLHAHASQASHLGKGGEPLLHLAFIAPDRESANARSKSGYIPQVFVEHDVVHASHEFTEQYMREKGLLNNSQIATERGGGEWSELADPSVYVEEFEPGSVIPFTSDQQ